jgi:hypothetical protein
MSVEHICRRTLKCRRRTSCPAPGDGRPGWRVDLPDVRYPFMSRYYRGRPEPPGCPDSGAIGASCRRSSPAWPAHDGPDRSAGRRAGPRGYGPRESGIGARTPGSGRGRASGCRRGRRGARVQDRQARRDGVGEPGTAVQPRGAGRSRGDSAARPGEMPSRSRQVERMAMPGSRGRASFPRRPGEHVPAAALRSMTRSRG